MIRLGLLPFLATSLFAAPQGIHLDYDPVGPEVVLNTDFTQIQPKNSPPINIANGVFVFRNVLIRQGVRVRATGSRPMIWVVSGTFRVEGKLTVEGADGARVDTLNSANFPTPGGVGHCLGGSGGFGSPNSTGRSLRGQVGFGPLQIPSFGGGGGSIMCTSRAGFASGGGGGIFSTRGDPYYKVKSSGTSFVQQLGQGGYGGFGVSGSPSRNLPGGAAGFAYFRDSRAENDFHGLGVDVNRRILILGELPILAGGSGGGGGGDWALSCAVPDPLFFNDEKGGGGGAGGGVIIVASGGTISVGPSGWICADGGDGGGGAWAGSSNLGAGGGGGAGGMVILYAKKSIALEVHGETYARGDYSFSISADGGVGRASLFAAGGNHIPGKYPPPPTAASWDSRPNGGFGGLGLVQLMAPAGANTDGTNTVLDDNIQVLRGGVPVSASDKQRYLAWRGFPNSSGVWVDDSGRPTNIGDNEGDIRPTPILLPVLF